MWTSIRAITEVMQRWGLSFWRYFTGKNGYMAVVAVVAAYVGLYKILEARYQSLAAQASSERAALLSLDSFNKPDAFISAMGNFGPAQAMIVPPEPELLKPWILLIKSATPNREALWIRARDVFDSYHPDYEDPKTRLRIDLRGANLRGADLHEVNLHKVDLRNVNLQGADLHRANLQGANLQGANLVGANLQKANLREAILREANLSMANLQGADLYKANISSATLRKADLTAADLNAADLRLANLRFANLRGVKGIETAMHDESDDSGSTKIRYKIGVSYQNGKFPFVAALQKSVQDRAKKLGVDLIQADAQDDVQRELHNVNEMLDSIDCLAFEAVTIDESKASIYASNLKGVPVIQFNGEADFNGKANYGDWVTFVGSAQAESGDLLAQWLIRFQEQSGKDVVKGIYLRGVKGQVTDVARYDALEARLKRLGFTDKINFLTETFADYDREKAKATVKSLLPSSSDLDFIIANNDSMVLGALDALDEHGIGGKVALAGIDGIPEALDDIKNGRIKATVFQDPERQGAGAIQACVDYLNGKELDKEILIPFKLVTIDNAAEFKKIADRVYPKSQ